MGCDCSSFRSLASLANALVDSWCSMPHRWHPASARQTVAAGGGGDWQPLGADKERACAPAAAARRNCLAVHQQRRNCLAAAAAQAAAAQLQRRRPGAAARAPRAPGSTGARGQAGAGGRRSGTDSWGEGRGQEEGRAPARTLCRAHGEERERAKRASELVRLHASRAEMMGPLIPLACAHRRLCTSPWTPCTTSRPAQQQPAPQWQAQWPARPCSPAACAAAGAARPRPLARRRQWRGARQQRQ